MMRASPLDNMEACKNRVVMRQGNASRERGGEAGALREHAWSN
jgi:hypothetical protein